MYRCPACNIELKRNSNQFGIFWTCPDCTGQAFTLSILRKSIPVPIVKEFWHRIKTQEYPEKRKCPACKFSMSEVPIMQGEKSIYVDICKKCNLIWFDPHELDSLPKLEIPKEEIEKLPQEAKEAIAKFQQDVILEIQRETHETRRREKEEIIYLLINLALRIIFRI